MVTQELTSKCISKLDLIKYGINSKNPFVFLDFEVFKNDWLLCFSVDGFTIKSIVNDIDKLKKLFLNNFKDRILIAYNGTGYDKFIMLAILNGINPKEVNDKIIKVYDFKYYDEYGEKTELGNDLIWYDPMTRNSGSLKTYEACKGENIYESEVDFNLDRKLTEEEIKETISYCSFDVKMLIQYFYEEIFDSFLGHIGLVDKTIEARPYLEFYKSVPKTDASLVGTYLCTEKKEDLTSPTECIKLPENIKLGKYKHDILEFLKTPIRTLRKGRYNSLNSWSLKVISKSLAKCVNNEDLNKLKNKEEKILEKLKKLKLELNELKTKEKLTAKQQEKINKIPEQIIKEKDTLNKLRADIEIETQKQNELQTLYVQLQEYECNNYKNSNYNYILSKIVHLAHVTENSKLLSLVNYLKMSDDEISTFMYLQNKKDSIYNTITIECSFELILNIKGIPHLFKTGGIHSVAGKSLFFDKSTEHDKNRRLLIADVGSLYPNLMRVFHLCSIGMDDPQAYAQMIFDRIKLKKAGDPFAAVLKLILNTTYGCMGSLYNNLYDPTNRLKVCIFGQCAIVDLLDKLEDKVAGLEIFQSNTDGIVISCEDDEYDLVESIIHEWESRTGLEMEIDESLFLAQRDVSNYILIEK